MYHDNDRARIFTRRAMMLAGGQAVLMSTLVGRMYYLQVVEADKYRMQADDNRISTQLLAPSRGLILDRNGIAMAVNQHNYVVQVIPEQTPSIDYTLDQLSQIILLTDNDRARIHKDARRHRSFVPITVRENLSWEEVARIEVNAPDLPGAVIDVGQSRYYPLQELGAHILGYVAAPSEADLQAESADSLLQLPGFRIGKAGVERVYDLALRGKGGTKKLEVNAVGRVINELERKEGVPGVDLTLTLDTRLQEFAARRLGDQSAAVVVLDIHSGAVIVMASTPSFDPNAFNRGLTTAEWSNLVNNPYSPLTNKAIAGQFAPGSTFKPMTALAALENNAITPDTQVFCPGFTQLGNFIFRCWKHGGHGLLNVEGALKHSCDVFFYEAARRVGIDRIHEMSARFGLSAQTGIDLPRELPGLVHSRTWKRHTLNQPWLPGETMINGIGQGYMLVTPLQLAVMVSRIANGGLGVVPHVARDLITGSEVHPRPAPNWPSLNVSHQSLDVVRQGMIAVCNEPGGTGYSARITEDGMWMAGKTGTAQVRHITTREREAGLKPLSEIPWKERDHALFIGFAPTEAPRYGVAVVVEHGGHGGSVAAPIARDILIEVQKRDLARMAAAPESH